MSENIPVTVSILDKEYRIGCPADEREALLESAEFLDRKMREIRDKGKVIGSDRIAVMAALNIADELLQLQTRRREYAKSLGSGIRALESKIDSALSTSNQLEL